MSLKSWYGQVNMVNMFAHNVVQLLSSATEWLLNFFFFYLSLKTFSLGKLPQTH